MEVDGGGGMGRGGEETKLMRGLTGEDWGVNAGGEEGGSGLVRSMVSGRGFRGVTGACEASKAETCWE